jgi:uncharacterized protein (TIGR03083 family)
MMPPIFVAELFPELSHALLKLLRSLTADEWTLPTVSSRRTVKDIVSHLLDGTLRRLSAQRDRYRPANGTMSPRSNESLMDFLNRLNDEWETGTRRLSPKVVMELIEWSDPQLSELFLSLDPQAEAIFPVAWMGEERSRNWMDVARDYTEKWHHTQQIFDATRRPSSILNPRLGHPCLDIFMRALGYTYRDVQAEVNSCVAVVVTGNAGGTWCVERRKDGWEQVTHVSPTPTAVVTMDQSTAWKLVTKRRSREAARREFTDIQITGDASLGSHVLTMLSVMA